MCRSRARRASSSGELSSFARHWRAGPKDGREMKDAPVVRCDQNRIDPGDVLLYLHLAMLVVAVAYAFSPGLSMCCYPTDSPILILSVLLYLPKDLMAQYLLRYVPWTLIHS